MDPATTLQVYQSCIFNDPFQQIQEPVSPVSRQSNICDETEDKNVQCMNLNSGSSNNQILEDRLLFAIIWLICSLDDPVVSEIENTFENKANYEDSTECEFRYQEQVCVNQFQVEFSPLFSPLVVERREGTFILFFFTFLVPGYFTCFEMLYNVFDERHSF